MNIEVSELSLKLDPSSAELLYLQVKRLVKKEILSQRFKEGWRLPSIKRLARENLISPVTIERAYRELQKEGYLIRKATEGYFISGFQGALSKVLLLLDTPASSGKTICTGISEALQEEANLELGFFYNKQKLLEEFLEGAKGAYDHILLYSPDTTALTSGCLEVLDRIPAGNLILLGENASDLAPKHRSVYEDRQSTVYNGLLSAKELVNKYNSFQVFLPADRDCSEELTVGTEKFCRRFGRNFYSSSNVLGVELKKDFLYIITAEHQLNALMKKAKKAKLQPGVDLGILSYIDNFEMKSSRITTLVKDWKNFGSAVREAIHGRSSVKVKSLFKVILRGSL